MSLMTKQHNSNYKHALLTPAQIDLFKQQGFIGPFEPFAESEVINSIADKLRVTICEQKPHPLYQRFSVRDYHLIDKDILNLICNDKIVIKLRQLLGDNLLIWRSKAFYKKPGEAALGWHQEWGLFNGEEIGNDKPSLLPNVDIHSQEIWNLTVWFALEDISAEQGPIRFAPSSHKKRYPIAMVPMTESEFWHDPFIDVTDVREIVKKANENSLVLDINTRDLFASVNTEHLTFDQARKMVYDKFSRYKAAATQEFDEAKYGVIDLPMKQGSYVIFTERCMHGSSANSSANDSRLAINFRAVTSDVLVYPSRLKGDYIDASNIDITPHQCVLISGKNLNKNNVVKS